MNKSSRRGVVALWDERTHLLLGVTVAAHSPQVLESSPQEDDEETPKESDHGRGEESPPHPLAVAVTGHIWRERDDHAHLGYVDGRVRVEFIPVFRHYRSLVTWPAPAHNNQKNERKKEKKNSTGVGGKRFRRFGELQPAPPDAPAAQPCFKSTTSRSSLPSHLASPSGVKSWVEQRDTRTIKYVFFLKKKQKLPLKSGDHISRAPLGARSWLDSRVILFDSCVKITFFSPLLKKTLKISRQPRRLKQQKC